MRSHQISKQSFKIITQYGDMLVVKQGIQHHHHHHHTHHHPVASSAIGQAGGSGHQSTASTSEQQSGAAAAQQQQQPARPIIMTFHDLGLNSELQFASFCECDEVKLMLQTFTMIHVNFIGQEFDQSASSSGSSSLAAASSLPNDFKYPTVEQMAECIVDICAQLRVRSFVALAVGAGAHIVSTLALIRPDLVHGLFLINPVVSSCSITEWLYFKMSALAGNHQILGGHQQSSGSTSLAGPGSSAATQGASDDQQQHRHSTTGLRRLWNAVHHHHHHHPNNNDNNNQQHNQQQHRSSSSSNSLSSPQKLHKEPESHGEESRPRTGRTDLPSTSSSTTSSLNLSTTGGATYPKPAAGARLRNLILSRNFLHGKHHSPTSNQQQGAGCNRDESPQSSSSRLQPDEQQPSPASIRRSSSVSSPSRLSSGRRRLSGGSVASSSSWSDKRPPFEYLMYHHFGTVSFQRFRRLSSDARTELLEQADRLEDPAAAADKSRADNLQDDAGSNHRTSRDSAASGQSGKSGQSASQTEALATTTTPNSSTTATTERDRAQESVLMKTRRRHQRSRSVSLSPGYLASISSDRQRAQYMQATYKQYFAQLNSHNLWLFAQSFVKRKTLSLRKDCGAAAHAAAAAAALGTSICVAFVGLGPVGAGSGGGGGPEAISRPAQSTSGEETSGRGGLSSGGRKDSSQDSSSSQQQQRVGTSEIPPNTPTAGPTPSSSTTTAAASTPQSKPAQQSALVAGTKVKRTFTCQTLIMCSSVHIHHDRALKLMSLLNPLQATWIKTDQLLVLEEKPEKVCQALRLFLQGIGYSMSTYERRLRLCSAQASGSSADSTGSNDSAAAANSSTPSKTARQTTRHTAVSVSLSASAPRRAGKMST